MTDKSKIKCPKCSFQSEEVMPTDSCLYYYICKQCKARLQPIKGGCCVFCSYGSHPCPPMQNK